MDIQLLWVPNWNGESPVSPSSGCLRHRTRPSNLSTENQQSVHASPTDSSFRSWTWLMLRAFDSQNKIDLLLCWQSRLTATVHLFCPRLVMNQSFCLRGSAALIPRPKIVCNPLLYPLFCSWYVFVVLKLGTLSDTFSSLSTSTTLRSQNQSCVLASW